MISQNNFFVTLPSNASMNYHSDNMPQSYKVNLANPLQLEGSWEVALTEIQYPDSWYNVTQRGVLTYTIYQKSSHLERPYMLGDENETEDNREFFLWEIVIEPGFFPTIEKLINHINSKSTEKFNLWKPDWAADRKFPPAEFYFNSFSGHVIFTDGDESDLKWSRVQSKHNTEILQILGFERQPLHPILCTVHSENKNSLAALYPLLYIYCDIVSYQQVGDTMAPLLRCVPLVSKNQSIISSIFNRPYYLPVSKGYISTVEIQICDDMGQKVKFQSGKVIIVLHFRRSRI